MKDIEKTAIDNINIINRISLDMIKMKNELREKKIYSKELFEFYTKTSYIKKALNVSERTI